VILFHFTYVEILVLISFLLFEFHLLSSLLLPLSFDNYSSAVDELVKASGHLSARWILSRLHYAVQKSDSSFANYEFSEVATTIYNFWLYDLCDVYLVSLSHIHNLKANKTNIPFSII